MYFLLVFHFNLETSARGLSKSVILWSLYLLRFHLQGLYFIAIISLSFLEVKMRDFFLGCNIKVHAFERNLRDQQWGNSISAGLVLQAAFVWCSAYSFFTVSIKWSHKISCRIKDNSCIAELEYITMACLIIVNYLVQCIFFILKCSEIFGCVDQCPWSSSFPLLPDLIVEGLHNFCLVFGDQNECDFALSHNC